MACLLGWPQLQSRSILLINICLQVARAKGGKRGRKASAETDNAEGTSAWHALHAQAVQTLQLVAQALWGGHSSQAGRHSMTSAPSRTATRAGVGGTGMGRDGTATNIAPLSFATLLDRQAADKVGGAHNSFLSSQASPGHYILCAVTVSFAPPHCAAFPAQACLLRHTKCAVPNSAATCRTQTCIILIYSVGSA